MRAAAMPAILRRVWWAALLVACWAPGAAAAAACQGTDLMDRFARSDPDFVRRIAREGDAIPFGRGKLFRLTKEGGPPSYLFGTLHSADPRIIDLPAPVLSALAGSKAVALELGEELGKRDPFAGIAPEEVSRLLLAPPDQRADKLLSADDLKRLEEAAEGYGIPAELVRQMRPSILAAMMAIPACDLRAHGGASIDGDVLAKAQAAGKTVTGLETYVEQFDAMRDFPLEVQRQLLVSAVRHLPEAENMFETLLSFYRRGEIGRVLAWAHSPRPVPTIDAPVPAAFYEALVDRRNVRMAERALPLLRAGSVFVAVGAAHLPGEAGLLRLFEKAGFAVTRVD